MNNKILFSILFIILLSPIIEILIEESTPSLGESDVSKIVTELDKNYFFFSGYSDECILTFLDTNSMNEECYSNLNELYSAILNMPNRPHKTSLDYKYQIFQNKVLSFLNTLIIVGNLAHNNNLRGHCYTQDELTRDGYNLSLDNETVLYKTSEEYKESYIKRIPRSVASDFMFDFDGSNGEMYMPDMFVNYKIGGERSNEHLLGYQMIVGWLLLADTQIGGQAQQLFEDNCTLYKADYKSELRTGISAEQMRKDYAEFFKVNLNRMQHFEKIIFDNEVEEGILYLSYYPGYDKLWVIAKIPEQTILESNITIDKQEYPADIMYPFIFLSVNDLDDGKHTFEISSTEKVYSIEFFVNNANIFVASNRWVIREKSIILSFLNYYDEDIIITKIEASNPDKQIQCNAESNTVVPYHMVPTDMGGYLDINSTSIKLDCQGLSDYLNQKVSLDVNIHWKFQNSTTEQTNIIQGEVIGMVE